jgi:hypothetical protein
LFIAFLNYNFILLHQALRIAPAMGAKFSNHIWEREEFLGMQIQRKAA